MRFYFGHPINTYNIELERALITRILEVLKCEVENPNHPRHSRGYKLKGMKYFLDDVIPWCDGGGVFLAFPDGYWGAGVYAEAIAVMNLGNPVYRIYPDGGMALVPYYYLKRQNVLSVDETRDRVRFSDGRMKPYFYREDLS